MRGGGYVLDLPADAVDIHRSSNWSRPRGPRRRATTASGDRLLTEAESLWRGDALADFAYEEFAQPTINRLSELRLAAIEERIELELASGDSTRGSSNSKGSSPLTRCENVSAVSS